MFLKIIYFILIVIFSFSTIADENRLIIASTTSTHDTGLLKYLNKEFNKEYGIKIHVIAVGTGQAIEVGKQGDADILLIHHTPSEIDFVKGGHGIKRYDLMYNDFIIVGPNNSKNKCVSIDDLLLKIYNHAPWYSPYF